MKILKNKRPQRGFTLVELLVVIAIIAILSVTAYIALGGQTGKARDARRIQDLTSIQTALELYFIENNSQYPATLEELATDGKLNKVPVDPSSNDPYAYKVEGKQYQLGTTLEGEEGHYKAYIIGNSETALLDGVDAPESKGCAPDEGPVDGDENCVPMDIWTK